MGDLICERYNNKEMEGVVNQEDFENEIRKIEQGAQKKIIAYSEIISYCQKTLDLYREEIRKNGFSDTISEIRFFKEQKQIPSVNLIYYCHLRTFELEYYRLGEALRQKFLIKKIDDINSFFLANLVFIHYIDLDQIFLDEFYFTRKFRDKNFSFQKTFYYRDPEFSTSHDLILSEVRAYQLLLEFLQSKLRELETSPAQGLLKDPRLQWTSSKVALTELVYALYHSGAINNGNSSLKDLVMAFEKVLGVGLGDYHHTFLRLRERTKPVKFIDKLRKNLFERMQELDG